MGHKVNVLFLCVALATAAQARCSTLPGACGSDKIQFNVKTAKHQPAPAPLAEGKAQIIFVENFAQNAGTCIACKVTTRVGIDGAWVGANRGNSYFADTVEPGEHHLCVGWQSVFRRLKKKVGLASLNAEAGKVYYYQIKVRMLANDETGMEKDLELAPLDEDQGKYLVKTTALATATQKK